MVYYDVSVANQWNAIKGLAWQQDLVALVTGGNELWGSNAAFIKNTFWGSIYISLRTAENFPPCFIYENPKHSHSL